MTVKVGAGPIGWFEDDFSAFRNDTVREAHLTAVARAGFDGICLNPGSARDVAAVHATLARHQLKFIAPTHTLNLTRETAAVAHAALKPHLRAVRTLGATELSVTEGFGGDMSDADWQRLGERLNELAAAFKADGMRLIYRPKAGTIVADAAGVDRLMAETDSALGLMLEATVLGDDMLAIARRHAARVAQVAPEVASDAVMAALPGFRGWTVLDEHAGHAPERVEHVHRIAA
jgi:inosose dehydratase